jgi:tetratricopeptide (TPR) repeat protein
MLGERDVQLAALRAIAKKEKIKLYEGWVCKCMGEILLRLGSSHHAEAEQWIQKAIDADAGNGLKINLGWNYALYGDFFKRQGDRIKAQNEFGRAVKILRECGADGWVKIYEKELAEL